MSTIRDPAYITDAGRTMMTAGGDVTYTKAVLYGQDISHLTSDQVKALTTIGSPLREVKVGISDKQNTNRGTTVILEATFQNDNLKADLPYTAVGFFAQKGNDEKLIAVAVANAGAYLTATSPDGVATDALDLKLAIAIGDATNVTATVDPAGSVTPATLNGAISETKQVLTALIDTKASQSNLDQTNAEVAKKADSEAVNSQLATKANTTDIDKQVKTLNDAINTKADKATVDAEISKIDFTPYAKTADVSEQIKAVSDEVATKVGADYSYSKAQLDEKLLALSTDTNGKVSADQVTALIADKANKADVDKQIKDINDAVATKADKATVDAEISKIDFTPYAKTADVNAGLAQKDDTTDVDAKIKTVTDLANTKASQDSLNKLSQAVDTKADKSDTYTKAEVDSKVTDAKNTAQASTDHLNIVKADKSNTYTKAEVDSRVNEAKSTAQSSDNQIWGAVNQIMPDKKCPELPDGFDLNSRFTGWRRSPNKSLKNMPSGWTTDSMYFQGAIDNNDGLFELALNIGFNTNDCPRLAYRIYAWSNWKPWKTIANDEDIASLQTQINTKHNIATPLFREIQNSNSWQDIFGVGNPNSVLTSIRIDAGGSGPLLNDFAAGVGFGGADTKGVLSVGYHNNQARITGGNGNGPVWSEDIAWKSDINSLLNTISTLQNQVNDLINQINYIKQNYLQGKRFPASQEAQAQQWENANPNGIAMIEK